MKHRINKAPSNSAGATTPVGVGKDKASRVGSTGLRSSDGFSGESSPILKTTNTNGFPPVGMHTTYSRLPLGTRLEGPSSVMRCHSVLDELQSGLRSGPQRCSKDMQLFILEGFAMTRVPLGFLRGPSI